MRHPWVVGMLLGGTLVLALEWVRVSVRPSPPQGLAPGAEETGTVRGGDISPRSQAPEWRRSSGTAEDVDRAGAGESTVGRPGSGRYLRPEVAAALAAMEEREARARRIPDGLELLASGAPRAVAVARILQGAGVSLEGLQAELGVVHGHLERLDQFGGFALQENERLRAAEAILAEGGQEGAQAGPPVEALRRMAELWRANLREYEDYLRRDVAYHLGVTDEAVLRDLLALVAPPSLPQVPRRPVLMPPDTGP